MITVAEAPFAAIDFESAGLRPGGTEVPVQLGIALMRNSVISDSFTSFLFIRSPSPGRAENSWHPIRRPCGRARLLDLWPRVRALLDGRWLVAHGSSTERRFLRAFPFHGFGPWIDTLKLSRAVWPGGESFALGDLIRKLGLESELGEALPGFRWHDALSDATASLVLLRRVIAETGVEARPAETLLRPNDAHYHRLRAR